VRASKYNAALLGPIVQSSRTLGEVIRRLGIPTTGGNYRHIAARIRLAGLDTSHFRSITIEKRCAAIAAETLAALAATSTSVAQVLIKLNMQPAGRAHRILTRRIRKLGVDTSHFRGQGWARGETTSTHPSLAAGCLRRTFSDAELFVENAPVVGGPRLVKSLLAMGWVYQCAWCAISKWRDQPLVLHLDHINGINNDNRLINLRLLCPNCHSQTDTYGNRGRRPPVL
jgi:hypothetical protein